MLVGADAATQQSWQAGDFAMSADVPPASSPQERKNLLIPNLERWPLDENKPVIELIDVSVAFGKLKVLDRLSLKVIPGKTTVIVGRSGSGKSVLLKLMMGLLRPDSGKVMLFGRDLSQVTPLEILGLRKRMGMLFQNYALFDALSVTDNVGFPLVENSQLPRREITELAGDLIKLLGLGGSEMLLPAELSGGMRKRVSLARALVANPEVVLFDEPTTGLDPVMIEKVDEMIALAHEQYQITSVIISHDMASTARLADLVGFLHEGKIVFFGTYQQFRESQLPPVKSFVDGASTSRLGADEEPTAQGGAVNDDEVTARVELPRSAGARASAKGGGQAGGQTEAERLRATEEPVVELVDVSKKFGDKLVLRDIDLAIYPKRTTVLIGASGSGKSVIIKHIMGLFKPTSGEIKVFGKNIVPLGDDALNAVRSRFGLVFQHAALLRLALRLRERRVPAQGAQGRVAAGDQGAGARDPRAPEDHRHHAPHARRDLRGAEEARRAGARHRDEAGDPDLRRADDGPGPAAHPRHRRHDRGDAAEVRHHVDRDQPRHGIDVSHRQHDRDAAPGADRGVRDAGGDPRFQDQGSAALHPRRHGVGRSGRRRSARR